MILCKICKKKCDSPMQKRMELCSVNCRFISYYSVDNESNCFMWQRSFTKEGNPKFHIKRGKEPLARKFSYLMKHTFDGNLYQNKYIMNSSCDKSGCVNPDHIFPALRKIRDFTFNEKQQLEIYEKYISDPTKSVKDLVEEYNSTFNIIQPIINKHRKLNNTPPRLSGNKPKVFSKHKFIPRTENKKCLTCNKEITEENMKKTKQVKDGVYAHCYPCYIDNYRRNYSRRKDPKCIICGIECWGVGAGRTNTCSKLCKFKSHYKKDKNGCWIWQFISKSSGKYRHKDTGSFDYRGTSQSPRQASYELFKEKITSNSIIRADCNNFRCVNPDHLKISTQSELAKEIRDKYLKDVPRYTKVTQELINKAAEKYFIHKWSLTEIATELNISRDLISKMCKIYNSHKKKDIKNICMNCTNEHDNTESEFCSPSCMQEFLLK